VFDPVSVWLTCSSFQQKHQSKDEHHVRSNPAEQRRSRSWLQSGCVLALAETRLMVKHEIIWLHKERRKRKFPHLRARQTDAEGQQFLEILSSTMVTKTNKQLYTFIISNVQMHFMFRDYS